MFIASICLVIFIVLYIENLVNSNIKRINDPTYTLSDKYNKAIFWRIVYVMSIIVLTLILIE